jgi:hypothetical protein
MIPDAVISDSEQSIESSEEFEDEVNNAKSSLLADVDAEIPEASPVYDGVISLIDLKAAISSFDTNNSDEVQVYEVD